MDICALLNSGGGVLLFNVFRNYMEVWPKGEITIEAEYEEARRTIKCLLKHIYPKVALDSHIFVTFVPVARNPVSNGLPA